MTSPTTTLGLVSLPTEVLTMVLSMVTGPPVTTLALPVRVDVRPGASPGTLSKPTLAVLTMVVPSTMPSPTSA